MLGRDTTLCDCRRCKLKNYHRLHTVDDHRIIYRIMKVTQVEGHSENALLDDSAPGPSGQNPNSRGASRRPSLPPTGLRKSSFQDLQTDLIKTYDFQELAGPSSASSSRSSSRAHSTARLSPLLRRQTHKRIPLFARRHCNRDWNGPRTQPTRIYSHLIQTRSCV